jgi:hypothetical protein
VCVVQVPELFSQAVMRLAEVVNLSQKPDGGLDGQIGNGLPICVQPLREAHIETGGAVWNVAVLFQAKASIGHA